MRSRLWNVFVACSQLLNAAMGGNPDETTSSRVGRASLAGKRLGRVLERCIDGVLGRNHCRDCIEWDEVR